MAHKQKRKSNNDGRALQRAAQRLAREFPGRGFAILTWTEGGSLQHVTTSRADLARMMATQLAGWAQESIIIEDNRRAS